MTDPRRPQTSDAQLPDPLDQVVTEEAPADAEEHGSDDARLQSGEGDVERETPDASAGDRRR
jgi:hypothetical protein